MQDNLNRNPKFACSIPLLLQLSHCYLLLEPSHLHSNVSKEDSWPWLQHCT